MAAAMPSDDIFYFKIRQGSYNAESFLLFLDELRVRLRDRGIEDAGLVMDNVAFHCQRMGLSLT